MEAFNRDNGQIYKETVSSRVRSMVPTWKKHARGKPVDPQSYRSKTQGSSTLRDIALRSCCWNVELFLPEALEHSGWHYAGMIYRHLKATDTLTFSAWTLFQQAYPNQFELNHAFRVSHHDSITSWSSIVKSLSVLDSSVLTRFCAYGMDLDLSQFMSLVDIPSLAALIQINHSRYRSDNRTMSDFSIRDWCRAVYEKKAFQKLKLLLVPSMSDALLRHLVGFPALRLVGVSRRCTGRTGALKAYGQWIHPGSVDEAKYTETICGSQHSIAEKTERLYRYAEELPPSERGVDNPVTLSLTCAAAEPALHNESISWFIRDPAASETQPQWPQDAKTVQDGSGPATKKRKVRQTKQQDVASLLGSFG
ncbi:hypothetical protein EKO04_000744 [Ascochyta lentis]|uniref:Uncharacterized protein n=1 Tax=Ascochyta lentis TaxID=205686 RepID=A0A8H7MMH2_9PLEO|nr:hypothetical protein EKO04_000744 [Ascochyta lentis]